MKLYYMPGACSIGIHVLLEEIGKPYDLQKIDGAKQEQYGPDFVKLNPKSKVPTLQKDDGSVLTEFPAIATWLARKNPDKGLLPSDADGEARALEAMDYVVSTMHMQGFSRMFRPGNYAPTEADHDALLAFVEEAELDWCGFFSFSKEDGTYAAGLDGAVPAAMDAARSYAVNAVAVLEPFKNHPAAQFLAAATEQLLGSPRI